MAPELVPEPKFRPLHEVLAEVYSKTPRIHCPFLEANGSTCKYTVKNAEKLDHAKHWVEKITQTLMVDIKKHPSLPEYTSQLCHYCFCRHHETYKGNPGFQWQAELQTKSPKSKSLKTTSLKEEFISLLEMNDQWPPRPRKLEFEAMPLGQHVETIDETVDRLLKKKLNGTDKHFLYVLSSREAEGKFKIGVCKDHPSDNRIDQHDKCYPNSEIRFIQMSKCAYRVEQLILAEFREYQVRLKEGCWVCFSEGKKVQHKEWLNVEEDILLERIFEWHDFFIGRPHNMRLYGKKGHFNSAAGPHSPPRQASPGRPKDLTPRENSGSPLSRSLTPRDGSPSPSSTAVWGMKKVSRNSPQPLSPPANSGRGSLSSSSRPSLLLNDNPIPFSITDGNIGRFSGEAPETPGYSTLTKSGRPSRPKLGTDNGGESGDSTESVTTLTWLMRNLGF